jgi:hypothetical protein
MRPTPSMYVALFSPAGVLLTWAAVVAIDGWLSEGWMIFFLLLLSVAVALAEGVRNRLRTTNRESARRRETHER